MIRSGRRLTALVTLAAATLAVVAALPAPGPMNRPRVQETNLPGAESILDRYIEVTGGKSAYARLHNILSQGSFYVVGSRVRGTIKAYEAEPNKSLSILEIEGGERIEEGTTGDIAWNRSSRQGPHLMEGDEKSIALREATFNSKLYWRKLYNKVECTGIENVGEQKCYKIVFTPALGQQISKYYDVESGLLVKGLIMVNSPAGMIASENYYSDYREFMGVKFSHKLVHRVGMEETVVVLDSVRCNVDIAWYRFDPPPEIKALLAKSRR
jgi:hypothetical protein